MASSYSAALPNPMISSQPTAMPPPPSDPATEMRVKRNEAINQARELYGHPAPAPTPTLQPIYPSSQVISTTSLSALETVSLSKRLQFQISQFIEMSFFSEKSFLSLQAIFIN